MGGSRWANPLLVLVGVLAWVDALAGGHLVSGPAGVLVPAGAAFLAGRLGRALTVAGAATAVALLLSIADQVAAPGQFSLASDGVFYAVLVGGPALAGTLIGARARQVGELRARTGELERRRPTVLLAARAEEGVRVAARVDAALADRLRHLVDGVHAAQRHDAPARLAEVADTARAALAELRDVLGVLGAVVDPLADPLAGPLAGPLAAPTAPTAPTAPAAPAAPAGSSRPPARGVDALDALLVLACLPLAVESAATGATLVVADVAIATLQGVLLTVVRRRAILGAAALMLVATTQTALLTPVPPLVSWLLPGLLTAFLVGRCPRRATAVVGLTVAVAGVLLITAATPAPDRDLAGLAPGLAMGVLAWWAGRTVASRERRRGDLAVVVAELTVAEEAETRLAAAEQRAVLARELHDVGAHALTVVCLQTEAALRLWDRDRARAAAALDTLVGLADDSLRALGRSLASLATDDRTPSLDAADLDVLVGLGRALGLQVEIVVQGRPLPLPDQVARAAFRVVQESLTNAARHAARSRVSVGVVYGTRGLEVSVTDAGARSGPVVGLVDGAGIGLRGMRDRVEACRGRLDYGPDGDGFRVRALIPLAG